MNQQEQVIINLLQPFYQARILLYNKEKNFIYIDYFDKQNLRIDYRYIRLPKSLNPLKRPLNINDQDFEICSKKKLYV